MSEVKEGQHYSLIVPENNENIISIKILQGEYKDVIYSYGTIKIKEEDKDGMAYLQFDYDVIESPTVKPKKLVKDDNFKKAIGDILVEIITNVSNPLQEDTNEDDLLNENRTDDTEKFNL